MLKSPSLRRFRLLAAAAAFFGLLALITAVAADAALRAIGYPTVLQDRVSNPPGLHLHTDNIEYAYDFDTNDLGLRYRTIPLEKEPDTARVFVVGDSFAEGMGVEADETFAARLEAASAGRQPRVEFINGGLEGTGPREYARMFFGVGLEYHPDGLLICLYANDVSNMAEDFDGSDLHPWTWHPPSGGLKGAIYALMPATYVAAKDLWRRHQDGLPLRAVDPDAGLGVVERVTKVATERGIPADRIEAWRQRLPSAWVEAADAGRFNPSILSYGLLWPDYFTESLDVDTPRAEQKWQAVRVSLSEMVRVAHLEGIAVAAVYVPGDFQYDPETYAPDGAWPTVGVELRPEWLTGTTEFQHRLEAWSAAERVPLLDLTTTFRHRIAEGSARPLNFHLDEHWTPEGHAVAAEAIGAWLQQGHVFPFLSGR